MFSLWYKLAFLDGDIISKIKKIIKSICIYILPTIVAIIVSDKVLIRVQYNLFGTVTNIIVFNLLYSSIIHIYIQKKTLSSLQGDVIVKFVPQKFNVYIILRVLMVFIKTYLPIITLSILTFKDIFINPVYIFYICSLAFIISIIFLNVIIAILYRYLLNIVNKLIYKLINFITFIYITSLVIYQSTVTPIWYLESLERYLKKEDLILNKIDINFFQIMLILIIFILSIMSINFLKNFLKIRGRNLIFIKNISVNEKSNKITKVIEDYCEKVYSIYFSNIEKSFFVKDIKEAVRTNKYSLFFICLYHIINICFILFFFFADNINSIEISIISVKISLSITIVQILISYFLGKASFEKNINIDTDYKVLKNYNIRVAMNGIIKVKTKVLSAIGENR